MIKLIILSAFIYFIMKLLGPVIQIFRFKQTINKKNERVNLHNKLSKMDIQDAEFEEK
jgi:hypothetical protein|tara:strand:+ start:775 stop:948 length:174 start_codon:yes stop_codon:yes gene_type:complete